jgi:ABC-2 type transport system permease protein
MTLANGWHRGVLELRQTFRTPKEPFGLLLNPATFIIVASFQDSTPGAHRLIAGSIGSMLAMTSLTTLPQLLVTDREDGTLLRLRGTPGGMGSYLVAKTIHLMVMSLLTSMLLLLSGVLFIDMPLPADLGHWAMLTWVLLLGIASVAPLGAAIGAVLPNPREALALVMLPVFALVSISGIFFPVSSMPTVLQVIAKIFPIVWINQGLQSALLPASAQVGQGNSLHIAGVLLGWTAIGFLIAPRLLMRMARRQSGSRLAEGKERAAQRGY